jgi:hypothetical protein
MRLWSLHPKYLDAKGLIALWREALLAKHVLEGKTRGYRNHPQLLRFREAADPLAAINYYLSEVYFEAEKRGYSFDRDKIDWNFKPMKIPVHTGQIKYERQHLLQKLNLRDPAAAIRLMSEKELAVHPIFEPVPGCIEEWKITKP